MRTHGWDKVPMADAYGCRFCRAEVGMGLIFSLLGNTRLQSRWDTNHKIHVLLHDLAEPGVVVRYIPPSAA